MEIKLDKNIVSSLTPGQSPVEQTRKQTAEAQTSPAAELSEDFGKIQQQALASTEDAVKVQQARQALLSGDLDSQEAILSAAENLLTFGL